MNLIRALSSGPMHHAVKDQEAEQPTDPSHVTVEQELKEWPTSIHGDLVAARARGQAQRQNQQDQEAKRGRRLFVALVVLLVAVIAGTVTWFLYKRNENQQTASLTPAPASPASLATSAELDRADFKSEVTTDADTAYYHKTILSASVEDRKILEVVQYEFRSGRFIVNNTELKNQSTLEATFRSLRSQLSDAWILIFASASVENTADYNLQLCERRLHAVKDLLKNGAGLEAHSYWGILAGEFKAEETKNLAPKEEELLEQRLASGRGESWLTDQRKLIIVTIRAVGPLTTDARQRVPLVVDRYIYQQKLLPHNYDASGNVPFLLSTGESETKPTELRSAP